MLMPHLSVANHSVIDLLQTKIKLLAAEIDNWFAAEWLKTPPPPYGSVDIRNAGFKIAPIDMNLFSAGFNNLNQTFIQQASEIAATSFRSSQPQAKKIIIIPENHTRNLFYFANLKTLQTILELAKFEVRLGSYDETLTIAKTYDLADGQQIIIEPLIRENHKLRLQDFEPDIVLLNNDLSDAIPPMLQNLNQIILPSPQLGWHKRLKSQHFTHYQAVAKSFAELIDIDPWLITPAFRFCEKVDFMQQEGMNCLSKHTVDLLNCLEKKYIEHRITDRRPFLIVKADAGTYGMAVMTVRHPEDLNNLNRKQRTRMSTTKGSTDVHRVIIQEGVYTFEKTDAEHIAEPVMYLFGSEVIGGFYRLNASRSIDENLNAPGMTFLPMNLDDPAFAEKYAVYAIIAKLSMLAAAREMQGTTE